MPLHLLGKKSWNVYNADNIARVRRDEVAAKAAEEAEEQRMQEIDAQRRLAILRGEEPPPLPDEEDARVVAKSTERSRELEYPRSAGPRRQRKRQDEDDTDYELRLAREKNETRKNELEQTRNPTSSAPIVDHSGHIDLFGDEKTRAHAEKNQDAEEESRAKRRQYEDQYTMRLANAAGRGGTNNPWYSQSDAAAMETPPKDVWGNEDPRRKERQAQRLAASDPLAMMKQGAAKVRELKKERQRIAAEREDELKQLRKEERRREKERHREKRHRDERHRDERHRDERHRDERHRDERYRDERERRRRSRQLDLHGPHVVVDHGHDRRRVQFPQCLIHPLTSTPSLVKSVGANHVTAQRSLTPSAVVSSPQPSTSQWLPTKKSQPLPRQSQPVLLVPPPPPAAAARVSTPWTVLRTAVLPVGSYSTRSSMRAAPSALGGRGL
ncbi:fungal specific transcription factor domain-containing protein [Purpureocillium lavendulum]|uniref:Fungal specific transcription factor domain-containing protein n=1 Tax=Purpureocillium lavendulum TaxID=1247861 RepID=A0AB34FTW8_9HYPO|nr:fungal specific transcription factor domain-containing protein [Purpureocillium lavendulum]